MRFYGKIVCFLVCICLGFSSALLAQANVPAFTWNKTATGFYWPTGVAIDPGIIVYGGTWLGRDAAHDWDGYPPYFDGQYHLGYDIPANYGDPVFAVSSGVVLDTPSSGWGTGNVAVLVVHTLANGTQFVGVYGHVHTNLKKDDVVTPSSVQGNAMELCDRFAVADVAGGRYKIQNNAWNSQNQQCLEIGQGTSWRITVADHNLPSAGPPASYPSIFAGCHWSSCTQSELPIQVGKLASAKSSWSVELKNDGAYNAAYDIWYNSSPRISANPDGAELMIWIARRGVLPAGSRLARVRINGADWEVWETRMANWNYIAYLRQGNVSQVLDLDIAAFTKDAVDRGSIKPSWYLVGAEAGFEIWQGGWDLGTNSFSFTAYAR